MSSTSHAIGKPLDKQSETVALVSIDQIIDEIKVNLGVDPGHKGSYKGSSIELDPTMKHDNSLDKLCEIINEKYGFISKVMIIDELSSTMFPRKCYQLINHQLFS